MGRLTCLHCQASTEGVVLCSRCQTTAKVALEAITANHGDLFTGSATPPPLRRRSGPSDPTGSAAGRDPYDEADAAADETRNLLSTWARVLADDRSLPLPRGTVPAMADFLARHSSSIATLSWAGEYLRQLLSLERKLKRIVSKSRGYWYGGICGASTGPGVDDWCPADLFVSPSEKWVRCRGCRAQHRVDDRRAAVIAEARETLLPVSLIARAAVSLLEGEPSQQRLEARLRKWVERGILDDYGVRVLEGRPRRVYRLGDVLDRLAEETKATTAR